MKKYPYTVTQGEMKKINTVFLIQVMLEGQVPNLPGTLEKGLRPWKEQYFTCTQSLKVYLEDNGLNIMLLN